MKKALTILAVLAVAAAAWLVAFPNKNPFKKLLPAVPPVPGSNQQPATSNQQAPTPTEQYRLGFPLSQGSKGTYVSAIQTALNKKYYTNLTVDGIFGPKTYRALSVNGYNPESVTFTDYQKIIS